MKLFRYVVAAAMLLGLSGVASATIIRVLDPSSVQGSTTWVQPGGTYSFNFFECPSGQAPNGVPVGDGCFAGYNDSPDYLTSLTATIAPLPGSITSPISCPDSVSGEESEAGLFSAFSTASTCGSLGDTITVDLSGGPGIAPFSYFWIVETGIPDCDFPPNDPGTFTVTAAPEPSSIIMALTGMSSIGYALRRRRKSISA